VAHDFNNLLAVIQGYAGLLVEQAAAGSPSRDAADTIVAAAELAGEVSRHLLSVVRPEPGTAPRADVNLLLNRLGRVLKAIVGAQVTLAITPAAELELAAIHPAELTQVLLNLTTNARDAMRGSGTLTIRTATQPAGPDRSGWPADVPAGEFVVLTISDTGSGMDEATRLRAFDPFFTTKAKDGHGIGLATIREIVARIGGHVELESEPGWGTQVRVYLRCV
jgi:signal transduction histidine kinase